MVFFLFPFVSIEHSWLYVRTINEDDDMYLLETCIIMCYNEGFDEEFYDRSCELYGDQYLIPYLKGNS